MMQWKIKADGGEQTHTGFIMGESGRIEITHFPSAGPHFNVYVHGPDGFSVSKFFKGATLDEAKAWATVVLVWLQSREGKAWDEMIKHAAKPAYQRLNAAIGHAVSVACATPIMSLSRDFILGRIEQAKEYLRDTLATDEELNILAAELEAFTPPPYTLPDDIIEFGII